MKHELTAPDEKIADLQVVRTTVEKQVRSLNVRQCRRLPHRARRNAQFVDHQRDLNREIESLRSIVSNSEDKALIERLRAEEAQLLAQQQDLEQRMRELQAKNDHLRLDQAGSISKLKEEIAEFSAKQDSLQRELEATKAQRAAGSS